MLKAERQSLILDFLKNNKFIKVSDVTDMINVADMTVRRDFIELEEKGLVKRIHGGAELIEEIPNNLNELSHLEKKLLNLEEKHEMAKKINQELVDGETIFIGPGTSLELIYDALTLSSGTIITNSIHAFNKFKYDDRFELILIGGNYRQKTGSFFGTIANSLAQNIYVHKAFVSVNALNLNECYTANADEGITLQMILNNSQQRYVVADTSKFNKRDFYRFYQMRPSDTLITNSSINPQVKTLYENYMRVI
ncbi:DeoR/GlpR family DNA-binding transcription regulator [Vaginisenegalia massiliensis]|uniref:DeoR/GlpR family DNA-binding transcription regulator n=1 Tax=Vaginisenegalia massiliensis TaxID=2058294 RepID=UPI000F54B38E|nr:DeoR/GlpR family DNA-binding transcription regulator [Vaginisenegalia massiliensis]